MHRDPEERLYKLQQYLELDGNLLSDELYAIRNEIHQAILDEREQCAKIVEMFVNESDESHTAQFVNRILKEVAAAIREIRGNQGDKEKREWEI